MGESLGTARLALSPRSAGNGSLRENGERPVYRLQTSPEGCFPGFWRSGEKVRLTVDACNRLNSIRSGILSPTTAKPVSDPGSPPFRDEHALVWQLVRVRDRTATPQDEERLATRQPGSAPEVRLTSAEQSAVRHRLNLRAEWSHEEALKFAIA